MLLLVLGFENRLIVMHLLKSYNKQFAILLMAMLICACTTTPKQLQTNKTGLIPFTQAQQQAAQTEGKTARWGGVITQVINNEQSTQMEVLALELNASAKPVGKRQQSPGRFIAVFDEFLDPEIYQKDQLITLIGIIEQPIKGKIGDYNYQFPKLIVQGFYLWPERKEQDRRFVPGIWPHHYFWPHSHHHFYGYGPYRSHFGWYTPYYSSYWSSHYWRTDHWRSDHWRRPHWRNGYDNRPANPQPPRANPNRPIKRDIIQREKAPNGIFNRLPPTSRPAVTPRPVKKLPPRARKIDDRNN
jgi:outer membrane lipoprotein